MGKGLRYNIEHVGDVFVDAILKASGAAKASARGIVLTYDLNDLKRKRRNLLCRIGERFTQLRKEGAGLDIASIASDGEMSRLLSEFDGIEGEIEAAERELEERLYPGCGETRRLESAGS